MKWLGQTWHCYENSFSVLLIVHFLFLEMKVRRVQEVLPLSMPGPACHQVSEGPRLLLALWGVWSRLWQLGNFFFLLPIPVSYQNFFFFLLLFRRCSVKFFRLPVSAGHLHDSFLNRDDTSQFPSFENRIHWCIIRRFTRRIVVSDFTFDYITNNSFRRTIHERVDSNLWICIAKYKD